MSKKVLLGMSGGIDSSVAAILLQEQGFDVVGITFTFSENTNDINDHNSDSAKELAGNLGIEHFTIDLRYEFKKLVIRYFVNEYRMGKTPFPCAVCNPKLKFLNLKKFADINSCDFIATGHYANLEEINGDKYITRGKDPDKDQSFFLWGLDKEFLNRLIFPLGNMYKSEVRELACLKGYNELKQKNESQGICFIEGNNYRKYLYDSGLTSNPGNFIDNKGNIIGKHKGIFNYTIGQRRGLGIHLNKPIFVSEIKPKTNEVVLSGFNEMYRSNIFLENTHFVNQNSFDFDKTYTIKIRYRLQENLCKIIIDEKCGVQVTLMEPLAMVANGQTAVIYDENRVIGGGFIVGSK